MATAGKGNRFVRGAGDDTKGVVIGRLYADTYHGEGGVTLSLDYDALGPVMMMDLIQDWMSLLQSERNIVYSDLVKYFDEIRAKGQPEGNNDRVG